MNKLLYFPYISLPNNDWMKRTLLYWDEVASIVPFQFIQQPYRLERHMQELVRNELVKQIIPEQYVYDFNNFEESFINYIESDPLSINLANIGKLGQIGNRKILKTRKIHMGKMRYLGDELVSRGLAIRKNNWYKVEEHTANSFMTYLAFLIGNKTEYIPSTDRYMGFTNILETAKDTDMNKSMKHRLRNEFRANILEKILPVPEGNIEYLEILRFKDRYRDELVRYRNYIENFLIDLDTIDIEFREEKYKRFLEESEEKIVHIKEKLSFFGNINIGFVTLCSLTSSIFPIVDAVTSSNNNSLPAAIPGLLGAVYSAIRSNDCNEIRKRPLAYAAITSNNYHHFRRSR